MTPWRRNPDGTRHRTVGRITLHVSPTGWIAVEGGVEVAGGECWDRLDGIEKADRWAHSRGHPRHRVPVSPIAKPEKGPDRMPQDVVDAVTARSKGRCEAPHCLAVGEHLHHRLMRSQGGLHTEENLLHLCADHHRFAHAEPERAYRLGLLIRRNNAEEAQ